MGVEASRDRWSAIGRDGWTRKRIKKEEAMTQSARSRRHRWRKPEWPHSPRYLKGDDKHYRSLSRRLRQRSGAPPVVAWALLRSTIAIQRARCVDRVNRQRISDI